MSKVIFLCGAPGSGKSTMAKEMLTRNADVVHICPDNNRRALGSDSGDQSVSNTAFQLAECQLDAALLLKKNVVLDATNMYRKARKNFLRIARTHAATVEIIVFDLPKDILLQRNVNRGKSGGRNVPEAIIDKMLTRYQRPEPTEFDKITIITERTTADEHRRISSKI